MFHQSNIILFRYSFDFFPLIFTYLARNKKPHALDDVILFHSIFLRLLFAKFVIRFGVTVAYCGDALSIYQTIRNIIGAISCNMCQLYFHRLTQSFFHCTWANNLPNFFHFEFYFLAPLSSNKVRWFRFRCHSGPNKYEIFFLFSSIPTFWRKYFHCVLAHSIELIFCTISD